MDLEGSMLSEISQTEKDKRHRSKSKIKPKTFFFLKNQGHRCREHIGGRQRHRMGNMGETGQMGQRSCYKTNVSWLCDVRHGDYRQ